MLLKQKFSVTFLLLICNSFIFGNTAYWKEIIKEAMNNSPQVQEINKDYISSYITKKQNDYLWFPYFQIDFSQNIEETPGNYLYIHNQSSSTENMWILNPNTSFSINQKLPGYGSLSLSGNYGINYIANRNVFLQQPYLQLKYNQNLGQGAFGITKNAERFLLNEQLAYSHLIFQRDLITQLKNILETLKKYDILTSETEYYNALFFQYQTEYSTAQEKHNKGLQSNLETYYAQHQLTNSKNQLDEILKQKDELYKEIILLIPNFDEIEFIKNRKKIREIIELLYTRSPKDLLQLENNIDSKIYSNMLNQQKYNYQLQELQFVPVFYTNASLGPNANIYSIYSDWYKSFRNLVTNPYPINFNCNIGIKINFESLQAKKLRKSIYSLEKQNLKFYDIKNKQNQCKEIKLLEKQLQVNLDYMNKIEDEINQEKNYRIKRKELFSQNIITQDEFYESETLYFLITRDYIKTFWNTIFTQFSLISLSSNYNILLTYFLGEDYEKLY